MDRGVWWVTVHGVAKSQTQLSDQHFHGVSQVMLVVKIPPAKAGEARDEDLIPGSGRSPGIGSGNHSSILAQKISWIEEPGGL